VTVFISEYKFKAFTVHTFTCYKYPMIFSSGSSQFEVLMYVMSTLTENNIFLYRCLYLIHILLLCENII